MPCRANLLPGRYPVTWTGSKVRGARDVLSSGQTPRVPLLFPGSRFRPLLRAGHAPHYDTPDAIIGLGHEAARAGRERFGALLDGYPHLKPAKAAA